MTNKWRMAAALILAAAVSTGMCASAEKGEIEIPKLSKTNVAKNEQLIENREFKLRNMEYLKRGLVAVKTKNGVFVSWRWLGTESYTVKYNLYRDGKKINPFPMNVTNFTDTTGTLESKYQVAAIVDGVEQEKCDAVTPWAENKLDIELDIPKAVNPDGSMTVDDKGNEVLYNPNECSIADLDADGEYEIVLKWESTDRQDNSVNGITSPCILDAYELDGTKMWRINLGYNIRSGAHYTQFMVYDLDNDGIAEIVCKTADGSVDNFGNYVGDKNKLWRDESTGRILEGPEYLSAFDGQTGKLIDTIDFIPQRGKVEDWGDTYGNRVDRFLGGVAYLDGENASVIMSRGYYTRMCISAFNLVDKKLQCVWAFDTDKNYPEFMGQGNHSLAVADVDYDAKDEVIYGGAVIDHDGSGLYSTGLGHGDAQHTSDLVPDHPGLEIFSVHEHSDAKYGIEMRDARTGEFLWGIPTGTDVGRGVSADIDPEYPGAESWAEGYMISAAGEIVARNPAISCNFLIYWDGDLGRELQDSNHIDKWVHEKNKTKLLFSPKGYVSYGGTKAPPGITCDMFGDWREETILFSNDRSKMAVFTTTDPTDYRIYTLMHDPQYRTYIPAQNSAYNQPPHVGFNLSYTTTEIPVSRAKYVYNGETVSNPDLENGIKYYPIESLMREQSVAMEVDQPFALTNGNIGRIDSENKEVVPYIKDGRTLVPLRFISEAFGAQVDWNAEKQEVTIKKDRTTIKMTIGANHYSMNRKDMQIDVPPEINNDRTFVPLRAVVEALGKKVAWESSGVIYINDEIEEISAEQAKLFSESITGYVEPDASELLPDPLNYDKVHEKQIPIYEVDASGNDGNIAEGAVDANFETRWNAYGEGSTLTVDFYEVKEVKSVGASFFKGDQRKYYFDIAVSEDGENWTTVLEKQESSGDTEAGTLEMFDFGKTVKARYVRYIGHGSSDNDANNIYEFVPIAP